MTFQYRQKWRQEGPWCPARDVDNFPYWVQSWAFPFESFTSLKLKYSWLNEASESEFQVLILSGMGNRRPQLYERLFSSLPKEFRVPRIDLWDEAQFPKVVCPICLEAGYWSDLPQIAGCERCPLHGTILQRQCKECLSPIWFGRPQFNKTSAFVCNSCGEPLVPFPKNVCLQWRSLSPQAIADKFKSLHTVAKRLDNDWKGNWHFPKVVGADDEKRVLFSMAENCMQCDYVKDRTLFAEKLITPEMLLTESVVRTGFYLPCSDTLLAAKLNKTRSKMIADLTKWCTEFSSRQPQSRVNLSMKTKLWLHELDFRAGGDLLENAMIVLDFLWKKDREKREITYSEHLDKHIHRIFPDIQCSLMCSIQIRKILSVYLIWQVCRVLIWLESYAATLVQRIVTADGVIDDETQRIASTTPYGSSVRWLRVGDKHFGFCLDVNAWIPPYRIRQTTKRIELSIFQFLPLTACQRNGGQSNYCAKQGYKRRNRANAKKRGNS